MYYETEKKIKELHKKEFKLPKIQLIWIIIYFVSAVPIICNTLPLVGLSRVDFWWWVRLGLGIIVIVVSSFMLIRNKRSKTHIDYKIHVDKIRTELSIIGLNSNDKINALISEIKEYISAEGVRKKWLTGAVSKVFWFVFWTPAGFLFASYLNNHPQELSNAEDLLFTVALLLCIAIIIIATIIGGVQFIVDYILQPWIRNQEKVLRYLKDILYYYQ
jgi:hypothetical protein